jgi:hypothetical protein
MIFLFCTVAFPKLVGREPVCVGGRKKFFKCDFLII